MTCTRGSALCSWLSISNHISEQILLWAVKFSAKILMFTGLSPPEMCMPGPLLIVLNCTASLPSMLLKLCPFSSIVQELSTPQACSNFAGCSVTHPGSKTALLFEHVDNSPRVSPAHTCREDSLALMGS